jgi:hypothetical protein
MRVDMKAWSSARRVIDQEDREADAAITSAFEQARSEVQTKRFGVD